MVAMSYSNALSLCMLGLDVYLNFIRKPISSSSLGVAYQVSRWRIHLFILHELSTVKVKRTQVESRSETFIHHKKSTKWFFKKSENRRIILTILPIELTEYSLTLFTTSAQIMLSKVIANRVHTIEYVCALQFEISTPVARQTYVELTTLPQFFPLILAFLIEFRVGRRYINCFISSWPSTSHSNCQAGIISLEF